MKHLFLGLIFTTLLACGGSKPQQENQATEMNLEAKAENNSISCQNVGDITADMSMKMLQDKFGKANVVEESVYVEGAVVGTETVLWKGTPRELWLSWMDSTQQKVAFVRILHPQSVYKTKQGIGVGTSLKDMVAANGGKPVTFSGFDWEYAGGFRSFNEGSLEKELPCFGCTFDFSREPSPNLSEDESNSIGGDREVSSENPVFKKIDVKISNFSINFNYIQN